MVDVVPMNGHDETELLMRAGALELNSNHPLARAIVEEAMTNTSADSSHSPMRFERKLATRFVSFMQLVSSM